MRYKVAFARLREHKHPYPDRTAYRDSGIGMDFDLTCQTWSNRAAMLEACKMSDSGVLGNKPWKPLIKD